MLVRALSHSPIAFKTICRINSNYVLTIPLNKSTRSIATQKFAEASLKMREAEVQLKKDT